MADCADRLGRSLRDLANIGHEIEQAGAHLKVIEQDVNTSTAAGRAFFGMLAVFAAFETDVRRERVRKLADEGAGPAVIARELGMVRSSVDGLLQEAAMRRN